MYPLPSHSIVPRDSTASALAANAHTMAAEAATLRSQPQPGTSHAIASDLRAARMSYRDLASDIKLNIAAYTATARDLAALIDADPSGIDQWQPELAQAMVRDAIDLYADGPNRVMEINTLIRHITNVLPKPSVNRDALLAHLIKKSIQTVASKDSFARALWVGREFQRNATLLLARTDLETIQQTIPPLATKKAQGWFREVGLCAQLSLEMTVSIPPVGAERIWAMLQNVETDVASVALKSALISDIVHALSDSMNSGGQHTTQDIYLRILPQLTTLPAKHSATLIKELIQQRHVLPPFGRDLVLDALLQQTASLPPAYRRIKAPPGGRSTPSTATAHLRVIEFADTVTPAKWCASLDRLINLVPPHSEDRAISLGSLAAKCLQHATSATRDGLDPMLHKTDYLPEFQRILTALDTTVPAPYRFLAMRALPSRVMPSPAYEQRLQISATRAARATVEGPPQETIHLLTTLLTAVRRGNVRP